MVPDEEATGELLLESELCADDEESRGVERSKQSRGCCGASGIRIDHLDAWA